MPNQSKDAPLTEQVATQSPNMLQKPTAPNKPLVKKNVAKSKDNYEKVRQ
jgi:hypothetical protein